MGYNNKVQLLVCVLEKEKANSTKKNNKSNKKVMKISGHKEPMDNMYRSYLILQNYGMKLFR